MSKKQGKRDAESYGCAKECASGYLPTFNTPSPHSTGRTFNSLWRDLLMRLHFHDFYCYTILLRRPCRQDMQLRGTDDRIKNTGHPPAASATYVWQRSMRASTDNHVDAWRMNKPNTANWPCVYALRCGAQHPRSPLRLTMRLKHEQEVCMPVLDVHLNQNLYGGG